MKAEDTSFPCKADNLQASLVEAIPQLPLTMQLAGPFRSKSHRCVVQSVSVSAVQSTRRRHSWRRRKIGSRKPAADLGLFLSRVVPIENAHSSAFFFQNRWNRPSSRRPPKRGSILALPPTIPVHVPFTGGKREENEEGTGGRVPGTCAKEAACTRSADACITRRS